MREQENVEHFLGLGPILREIRLLHFVKAQLQPRNVYYSLDGQCRSTLYNYINQALKYQNNILTENFKILNVLHQTRKHTEFSETIKDAILGLGMQISEIPAQGKFVSAGCHAHFNAHKPPKTVAPTVLMLE